MSPTTSSAASSAASLAAALAVGPVVLDGGLSTELEARGHDIGSALWSARLLRDDPAAVVAAHAAFAAAGAQVATTASYQAALPGLAAAGLSRTAAERLIASSVALAREGAPDGWVAGAVGPYGAHLADGSEYTGAYLDPGSGVALPPSALRAFHRPQLQLLAEAGADALACETLPGAAEVDALLAELDDLGVPAWVSLSAVVDAAGAARTRRGELLGPVLAAAASVGCVVAVGVNCLDPAAVLPSLRSAPRGAALAAYPNSGEGWDARTRTWQPAGPDGAGGRVGGRAGGLAGAVPGWVAAGARLVGGCCRVGPDQVRAISRSVSAAVG